MINIRVYGGVGEYGRACFLVEYEKYKILLDCGINKENLKIPDFNNEVKDFDYVFLTHAHVDHYGALPDLYRFGYSKKVYMTRSTVNQLCEFFKEHNTIEVQALDDITKNKVWYKLKEDLEILWGHNGHMPGAMWIAIKISNKIIFYSGDYISEQGLLPHDNPLDILKGENIDIAIVDSGSGSYDESYFNILKKIKYYIDNSLNKGGSILFPSHIYGKGTEIFIYLYEEYDYIKFAITKEFYDGVKELIKLSGKNIELDLRRLEVIDNDFDNKELENSQIICFCKNLTCENNIDYKIYKTFKKNKNNRIIFCTKQVSGSLGYKCLNDNKIDSIYVNIKSHQSINEANRMIKDMNVKDKILFHTSEIN